MAETGEDLQMELFKFMKKLEEEQVTMKHLRQYGTVI